MTRATTITIPAISFLCIEAATVESPVTFESPQEVFASTKDVTDYNYAPDALLFASGWTA